MKKILLVTLAIAAASVGAPAAHAAGADTIHGGCFFDTDEQAIVTSGQNVGVIGDYSVTQDPSGLPTDATVTCSIIVNGVEAPGTRFSYSGAGVQNGVDRISYTAADTDWVDICQSVTFADGTTQTECPPWSDPSFPPQFVIDLLNGVFDAVNAAIVGYVDPAVCPELVAAAGSYGPITIEPDGDVFVPDPVGLFDGPLYDCPPYRTV